MSAEIDTADRDDPFASDPAAPFGEPGEGKGGGSWWLAGLGALIVGGGWLGMEFLAPGAQPIESSIAQTATLVRTTAAPRTELILPRPIEGEPQTVDPAQVRLAYAKVRDAYAEGGPDGLAGGSKACFAELRRNPDYALLDFCMAFDMFAEAIHRNGGGHGEAGRWFAEGDARRVAFSRALMNGADPDARLAEVSQLTTTAFIEEPKAAPPAVQKAVVRQAPKPRAAVEAIRVAARKAAEPETKAPSALDLKPVPPPGETPAPTREYQAIPYNQYVAGG